MTDQYLGVDVTRSISNESNTGILDEVMERKGEVVSNNFECDLAYRASVHGTGSSAEEAFSDAYRSSKLVAYPSPEIKGGADISPSELDPSSLSEPDEVLSPIKVLLGAEIEGREEHSQAIQRGVEALDSKGFEPYVELHATYPDSSNQERSLQEVVEGIEDQVVRAEISSASDPVNNHPDSHYVVAKYDPDSQTLNPDSSVCAPAHGTEEEAVEINQRMEEALDEVGLLE